MANTGIAFSLKKKQITIKISNDVEVKDVIGKLKKKMPEIKKLYKEVEPEVSVIGKEFTNREINEIQKIVDKYFDVDVSFSCSKMLGLYGIRRPFKKEIATSETMFHRSSLRSGQKVEFEGSIVVLGDVNFGAEVIAGENIVVLGNLRGLAHAGAKGNKEAIISAGAIEAMQVRISNVVKECEPEEFVDSIIKTNAYLNEDDEIVVE